MSQNSTGSNYKTIKYLKTTRNKKINKNHTFVIHNLIITQTRENVNDVFYRKFYTLQLSSSNFFDIFNTLEVIKNAADMASLVYISPSDGFK